MNPDELPVEVEETITTTTTTEAPVKPSRKRVGRKVEDVPARVRRLDARGNPMPLGF